MEEDRQYLLHVLWGERGTGNRLIIHMQITKKQYELFCKRTAYQQLLLFECNNILCGQRDIMDFQNYETECVVEGSREDTIVTNLLRRNPHYKTRIHMVDLTAPEFHV